MASPHLRARNALADAFQTEARSLVGPLVSGDGSFVVRLASWLGRFLDTIAGFVAAGFRLGFGKPFDDRAVAVVSDLIATQHGFAKGFAGDIRDAFEAGAPMSEAAIGARSELYAGGVVNAHAVAEGERWSVLLPATPCDQSTPCKSNCRCYWSFEDTGTVILATWHAVDDLATCPECEQRGREWNPLNLNRPEGLAA